MTMIPRPAADDGDAQVQRALAQEHGGDLPLRAAERAADADFLGAPRHRAADQTEQARRRQDQR